MSWTTVCDFPMTTYRSNQILDTTDFHNNANLLGDINTHSEYVTFQGADAQLEVPVLNDSLSRFAALRIQAFVRPRTVTHRYNIVEGWMSFAFFIESDGRLIATIYDGNKWIGPDSGSTTVPANKWSRISFEYDGISIAKLKIDGKIVGSRLDMPYMMRQPQQVITLGHWPRRDDRYTFQGDLGHIRIERRDYEDIWRDAMQTAFCKRHLTSAQANAKREIEYLFTTLDPSKQEHLRECAIKQMEHMRQFMNKLRGIGPREVAHLRQLGDRLRAAWCCSLDISEVRKSLLNYFKSISDKLESKENLGTLVEEFFTISNMCVLEGYPYDRIRELSFIVFPDLRSSEMELRETLRLFKKGDHHGA